MSDAHLFDPGDPIAPEAAPDANLGADARRTLRRNQQLAAGIHPRTRLRLLDPNPDAFTCGDCELHFTRNMDSNHRYHKCGHGYPVYEHEDGTVTYLNVSSGPATDVRLSWPACSAFKKKTPPLEIDPPLLPHAKARDAYDAFSKAYDGYFDAIRRGEHPPPPPLLLSHTTPAEKTDG